MSTTFGASIVKSEEAQLQPPVLHSDSLTPRSSHDAPSMNDSPNLEYHEKTFKINSPFYQHPPASFERVHSHSASKHKLGVQEADLESGAASPLTLKDENPFTSKVSIECSKECKMWPSKQTLMEARMAEKKRKQRESRNCCACGGIRNRWMSLSKARRLTIEILLAILIIGVIVAVAVGVTKAVNGQVYKSEGNNAPLTHP